MTITMALLLFVSTINTVLVVGCVILQHRKAEEVEQHRINKEMTSVALAFQDETYIVDKMGLSSESDAVYRDKLFDDDDDHDDGNRYCQDLCCG